jgi:Flp pilus assembly protein TadB
MKIPSLFSKTPPHRKFSYTPRFYDPREEERKEREERIRKELSIKADEAKKASGAGGGDPADSFGYRERISGSFKSARRTASRQRDPSAAIVRFVILTFLVIWLVAYLQYGNVSFIALLLFIPFYLFLKRRNQKRDDG